ncbi:MAG: DUF5682 family protein [Cyanobacteria bacterium P01_A01_bin.45]
MTIHIFGIRHHGSGSARSLCQALEELRPDVILIEGPPEGEKLLSLVTADGMEPPVALLIYRPDSPQDCVYYPFAVFSPEWQGIKYGSINHIPVRFMDLPQTHRMGIINNQKDCEEQQEEKNQKEKKESETQNLQITQDPLGLIAQAAGYSDNEVKPYGYRERWWEHMVENRSNSVDLFTAILEVMTAARLELPPVNNPLEAKREAFMRQTIRNAQKQGFERIAVICGAWHAPALTKMPPVKEDAALLKGLPKIKVEVTWVPWTYGRLAYSSGYGAGIESPGWYDHLWEQQTQNNNTPSSVSIAWMTKVARLLREQDLDASSAHAIEAVRLADSLAALRNHPLPGLPELNEAAQTVFCFGSDLPMQLIHDKLIVGERLGQVPDNTPMVPLQQDVTRQQKRLRMSVTATEKTYDLDLRKENDLARSHLFHRLNILDIPWGILQKNYGKKGTFHEYWKVVWHPEFAVKLIEAGIWGNTLKDAATGLVWDTVQKAQELPILTHLLDKVILADLPQAVNHLMTKLENLAATTRDVTYLMSALPPLTNLMRYGSVRQTDTSAIADVVDGLVTRICIGLPSACTSLDEDAAALMYENIVKVNGAISLLQNPEYGTLWRQVLTRMADNPNLHGLIAGRCCRLLLDAGIFDAENSARRLGLALSTVTEPSQAGAWVEGFLKGSGLLLLHDDILWQVLDDWVSGLSEESFITLLPLLRRTFATFTTPERRQMGERARKGVGSKVENKTEDGNEINRENAALVLPIVQQLLGV